MTTKYMQIPVRIVNNRKWGWLSAFGERHEFCGEDIRPIDQQYSFADQHRVRLYVAKKNVHWRIPEGFEPVDISQVQPANPPRRLPRR